MEVGSAAAVLLRWFGVCAVAVVGGLCVDGGRARVWLFFLGLKKETRRCRREEREAKGRARPDPAQEATLFFFL